MFRIKRVVDLSMPLDRVTPVYPGDPPPELTPVAELGREGYNLHRLALGTHLGTHVDAPFHTRAEGFTVDRMPLSLFAGEGVVVDVSGKGPGEPISVSDVAAVEGRLAPGRIALLHTGWSRYCSGDGAYFRQNPYLTVETCRFMLERGILAVGIDAPNIDAAGDPALPVHRLIAGQGGVVVENLVNLALLNFPRPLVLCFPLNMVGADASPVRAVALELENVSKEPSL